jgi:transposase
MNEKPPCPKCQSIEVVKNGKVQGKQRYKCKSCSLQFTRLTPRGRPAQEKAMAVTLYTLGLSIRAIARLIGVSPTAVLKWIKTFAKTHYEKPAPGDAIIVELDEMWHYLGSKKTSYGSGKLIVEKLESLLTGNVEEGIRVRYRN